MSFRTLRKWRFCKGIGIFILLIDDWVVADRVRDVFELAATSQHKSPPITHTFLPQEPQEKGDSDENKVELE